MGIGIMVLGFSKKTKGEKEIHFRTSLSTLRKSGKKQANPQTHTQKLTAQQEISP